MVCTSKAAEYGKATTLKSRPILKAPGIPLSFEREREREKKWS